jgi:uncharacterized membrane protein YfcA
MAVIVWLGVIVLLGALAGVWRARTRGPRAIRQSLLIFVVALVAIGLAWYVKRGS